MRTLLASVLALGSVFLLLPEGDLLAQSPEVETRIAHHALEHVLEKFQAAGHLGSDPDVVVAPEPLELDASPAAEDPARARGIAARAGARVVSLERVLTCTERAETRDSCTLHADAVFQFTRPEVDDGSARLRVGLWSTDEGGHLFMQVRELVLECRGDGWIVTDERVTTQS